MERSKADKTSRATASADSTAKAYCPRGLVFLNNRHYDPATGVFVSVDPLVSKTMQPYIYGAANPVTYSDPNGLEPRPIHCKKNCGDPGPDPYHSGCGGYGCSGGYVPHDYEGPLLPNQGRSVPKPPRPFTNDDQWTYHENVRTFTIYPEWGQVGEVWFTEDWLTGVSACPGLCWRHLGTEHRTARSEIRLNEEWILVLDVIEDRGIYETGYGVSIFGIGKEFSMERQSDPWRSANLQREGSYVENVRTGERTTIAEFEQQLSSTVRVRQPSGSDILFPGHGAMFFEFGP